MEDGTSVAVSGTHGKTTTAAMLSFILEKCGYAPTFVIGGELSDFGTNARLGKKPYVIVESDESDGSFLNAFPDNAIITNVELDHMDFYVNSEKLTQTFSKFVGNIKSGGRLFINKDDLGVNKLNIKSGISVFRYSVEDKGSDIFASDINLKPFSSEFTFCIKDKFSQRVNLSCPGIYNVSNALPALAFAVLEGANVKNATDALQEFKGIKRRFEIKGSAQNIRIIDDYAHHPTEIKSTLKSTLEIKKHIKGRIIVLFQPHRYTRTLHFKDGLASSLKDADMLIITDIYSAGENPIENVSAELIYNLAKNKGLTSSQMDNNIKTLLINCQK